MSNERSSHKVDLFYILFIFLFCALIGWIFETVEMTILKHQFVGRGYLFVLEPLPHYFPALANVPLLRSVPLILGLPLIEIYGFGAIIAIFGFRKLEDHPVRLFLTGMVVLTLFELLGSYFCTGVLHKRYWDYSGSFLNFQGRISLMSALAWGAASVLAVKGVKPIVGKLYTNVRHRRRFRIIVTVLMLGALVCALSKYWWFSDILSRQ